MLLHVTINSGTHVSYNQAPSAAEIAKVAPLVEKGGVIPGHEDFQVFPRRPEGGCLFTIVGQTGIVSLNALAWEVEHASRVWASLGKFVNSIRNLETVPGEPGRLPWLATICQPGMFRLSPEDVYFIGVFERVYAQAILDCERQKATRQVAVQ